MGTTAYGGKGSKGRAANGDRPVGATSCRRDHHTMASCQNPPPRRHRREDPQTGTRGPPSQNRQHQARSSGPPGKGTPKHADTHHEKKKEPAAQPERKGMGGQGPEGPGQGHPATDTTKQKKKTQAQKTHPDSPAKKGGAQSRPGPSTHAHTAHRNRKRRGASGVRTKPHTSHKQAET